MTNDRTLDLLVVDDDPQLRATLLSRFARQGFQVQAAGSGEEALRLAERRNFDVAIVDVMMPGMSGLELLRRLKEEHPECEVIVLTGQGTIESAVEAMKGGAFDYLQKPFPLKELDRGADSLFRMKPDFDSCGFRAPPISPPHDHVRFDHFAGDVEVRARFVHVKPDRVNLVAGGF